MLSVEAVEKPQMSYFIENREIYHIDTQGRVINQFQVISQTIGDRVCFLSKSQQTGLFIDDFGDLAIAARIGFKGFKSTYAIQVSKALSSSSAWDLQRLSQKCLVHLVGLF